MKTKITLLALFGLVVGGAAFATEPDKPAARVEVTFVNPEKFTDVKDSFMQTDRDRDYILERLKEHLVSRAPRFLAEGERLEIKFTNIDLAGDFEPWRGINFDHIRIMKDIYPPRMALEFRLLGANGEVVKEGKREVQDFSYLMSPSALVSDSLYYDKELLTNWLRSEFKRAS